MNLIDLLRNQTAPASEQSEPSERSEARAPASRASDNEKD